jgi:hypothetical protein
VLAIMLVCRLKQSSQLILGQVSHWLGPLPVNINGVHYDSVKNGVLTRSNK